MRTVIALQVLMAIAGRGRVHKITGLIKTAMVQASRKSSQMPLGIKTSCRQGPNEGIRLPGWSRDKSGGLTQAFLIRKAEQGLEGTCLWAQG